MVRWKRSQMPLVCGCLAFVLEWSISSMHRYKLILHDAPWLRRTLYLCRSGYEAGECLVASKKGSTLAVEHISCHQCSLAVIKAGKGYFAVSVDKGLLINTAYAFNGTHIISILSTQIAGMMGLDLAKGLLFFPCFFKGRHLVFAKDKAFCCGLLFQGFEPLFKGFQFMAEPYTATPAGEMKMPFFFNSLLTLSCPKAGFSVAMATTASSMYSSIRFFKIGFFLLISCRASSPPSS